MEITVNGERRVLAESLTIQDFLVASRVSPERVVVELNGRITAGHAYSTTLLQDADVLEILRFVGGG